MARGRAQQPIASAEQCKKEEKGGDDGGRTLLVSPALSLFSDLSALLALSWVFYDIAAAGGKGELKGGAENE